MANNVLTNSGLLRQIFSSLGEVYYLFIGTVSKGWRNAQLLPEGDEVRSPWTRRSAFMQTISTFDWGVSIPPVREELTRVACPLAAQIGDISMLQYAIKQGCSCDDTTSQAAAFKGQIEVLQWLKTEGHPLDKDTFIAAIRGGQLPVLEWSIEQGYRHIFDGSFCKIAAEEGNLEILQWLRSQGCPWWYGRFNNATEMGHAAVRGKNINLLRWVIEQGCPWDEQHACERAFGSGHFDSVVWMHDNEIAPDENLYMIAKAQPPRT
jgi:hypothetical protein